MAAYEADCDSAQPAKPHSVEQALDLLLTEARPIDGIEISATADCLARVLAEPLASDVDVPHWDNSAMDGYAVRHADIAALGGQLRVAQRIPAGRAGAPLVPGTAARIFTGAPLPENADTVVIQEICTREGDSVCVNGEVTPGANIRRRGEELSAGDEIIAVGTRLGPQHLGLAAAVGAESLKVRRRLKVAVLATGDELIMPGEALTPGKIYNSNRFLFRALLQGLGCEVIDLGIVADDLNTTRTALASAAEQADLVMASGGVSVGEEDHVREAVEQLGHLDLWRVAMRPGKPLAFGQIGATPFIGSPGNPVSLFVTFCLFARPFILRMQGVRGDVAPIEIDAQAGFDLPEPRKRREYQRARLERDAHAGPVVRVFRSGSSAALSSLTWANGLVVVPEMKTIAVGDPVRFIPFSELIS